MSNHRVPGGWQGSIKDTRIEPVAMHPQFLGQAKHRPLILDLGWKRNKNSEFML
jgi:hypothetical protein